MKILMVSMSSIHFFRWTDQLKDSGHEVFWFDILDGKQKVDKINWVHQIINWKLRWDYPGRYLVKKKFPKLYAFIQKINERKVANVFEQKLLKIKPDVVHSFALQVACKPIFKIMIKYPNLKWAFSSWGGDIFFYDKLKIMDDELGNILKRVDYLITDCKRDFKIAKEKGFENKYLGVLPGNGGVKYEEKLILPFSERKIILIKGYNDTIGKGINIIKAITEDLLPYFKDFTIFIFGADEEVVRFIKKSDVFKNINTKIYLKSDFIENNELLKLMGSSYIYIGNSISDGLPNTLIEAAGMGAFPIQSNPGNVTEELINNEQNGLLIQNSLDCKEIENLIKKAMLDSDMVKKAFNYNTKVIKNKYGRKKNKIDILKLYEGIC